MLQSGSGAFRAPWSFLAPLCAVAALLAPMRTDAAATEVLVQPVTSPSSTAAFPADCDPKKLTIAKSDDSKVQQLDCALLDLINSSTNGVSGFTATTDPAGTSFELHGRLDDKAVALTVNVIDRKTDAIVGTVPITVSFDPTSGALILAAADRSQARDMMAVVLQTKTQPVRALSVPGVGALTAPVDTLYSTPARSPVDFSKVLLVAIDGYDPGAQNLDAQVAYAFNSFRRIYAAHTVLAVPIAEPTNLEAIKEFCAGPLGPVQILHVNMAKDQRANSFLDAIYTGVQFDAVVKECGADKASFIARNGNYSGNYRNVYYRNFVAGVQAGAAYSSSPFITKYKSWLLFPLAFLGSFAHEAQTYNGTVYCAAVAVANKHLADVPGNLIAPLDDPTKIPKTPNCKGPGLFGVAPLNL